MISATLTQFSSSSDCLTNTLLFVGQFNPIALRKAKISYNFGLFECNRVKQKQVYVACITNFH